MNFWSVASYSPDVMEVFLSDKMLSVTVWQDYTHTKTQKHTYTPIQACPLTHTKAFAHIYTDTHKHTHNIHSVFFPPAENKEQLLQTRYHGDQVTSRIPVTTLKFQDWGLYLTFINTNNLPPRGRGSDWCRTKTCSSFAGPQRFMKFSQ